MADGSCNFTLGGKKGDQGARDTKEARESPPKAFPKAESGSDTKQAHTSDPAEDSAEEDPADGGCPICAYVKKGSCKDKFVELQGFHDTEGSPDFDEVAYKRVAQEMYECMSKDEYYDAFVMDLKKQAEQETAKVDE